MPGLQKQLIDDGALLFEDAPFHADLATTHVQIGPQAQTNNSWHVKDGIIWIMGPQWPPAVDDTGWPDRAADAARLASDRGNPAGTLCQTIDFSRPGKVRLKFWLRAGSYESSEPCAAATLTFALGPILSEDIPASPTWQLIEKIGSVGAIPLGEHTVPWLLSLKGKDVREPCAPVVLGFDLRYVETPVARLTAPLPVEANDVLIALDQPVVALTFHLTDGPSGASLGGAWVTFTLVGTGVRFVSGNTVTLQCDANGDVTIPAGTMTAGASLSDSRLNLAVDAENVLTIHFIDDAVRGLEFVADQIDSTYVNQDFPLALTARIKPSTARTTMHFAIDGGKLSTIRGGGASQDVSIRGGKATVHLRAGGEPEGFHVTASVAGYAGRPVSLARWVNPIPDDYTWTGDAIAHAGRTVSVAITVKGGTAHAVVKFARFKITVEHADNSVDFYENHQRAWLVDIDDTHPTHAEVATDGQGQISFGASPTTTSPYAIKLATPLKGKIRLIITALGSPTASTAQHDMEIGPVLSEG